MTDVTLAILAGGQGRRMGFPKQNLRIKNQPILEYLIDRFNWGGPTLLITTPGRERPEGTNKFDREVVDAVENQGPLRGVLTALQNAKTPIVVVTTVDMPGLTTPQRCWLTDCLISRPDLLGLMLQRSIDGKPELEPFPFACRIEVIDLVTAQLDQQRRSMHSLTANSRIAVESAPAEWPPLSWINLNTPEAFQAFVDSM